VRNVYLPAESYDLVVTQFFLDNFRQQTVDLLARNIASAIIPGGHWLNTDFSLLPSSALLARHNRLSIAPLYRFFRACCRIEATQLPDAPLSICAAGLHPISDIRKMRGYLASTVFHKPPRD
jgi:hypothetical protein